MTRPILDHDKLAPEALKSILNFHSKTVSEVISAVQSNRIVVVGMGQNPFVKKSRKALEDAGIPFKYLEFGNYLSHWKPRLAIKLWSGWPTYPQIFVEGKLIGGHTDLVLALKTGEVK